MSIDINEMNRAIADFMNLPYRIREWDEDNLDSWRYRNKWYAKKQLQYHSSWDWLMPVVEKAHEICQEMIDRFPDSSKDIDDPTGWRAWSYRYIQLSTDINRVHKLVYKFIQWYNQNKPTI